MANSAQARKRARQAVKQRAHNMSLRSTLRTAIKKVQKAILGGDKTAALATRAACLPPSRRSDTFLFVLFRRVLLVGYQGNRHESHGGASRRSRLAVPFLHFLAHARG